MFKNFKVLFILLCCFVFTSVSARNLTPVEIHGKLKVNGVDIVDKNNDKYQLRGVSTHGIAWFPQYVNQQAFEYMRDEWGINAIRLAMYSDPNAGYSSEIVSKLKQGVEYAKNVGLYVIIDWHILNDNNPNIYKNEAIEFFKEVSNLYKDYDNIIYEICNEPNGDVKWDRDIKPYAEEVISVIRENDKDAIIVVGTPTWSQDVDIVSKDPIKDYDNIMYTLHFYADTHRDNIREKLKTARSNNLPVFITEFGMIDASGQGRVNYDEADKWMELIDEYNISYMVWALSNKDEGASLIRKDVTKTTDWTYDELREHGKWFYNNMKRYKTEVVEEKKEDEQPTTEPIVIPTDWEREQNKKKESDVKSSLLGSIKYIVLGFVIGLVVFYLVKKGYKNK